jgi:rod shape-determining protein MreB
MKLNFGKRIGIDLGTANSIVYLAGEGIVLNEPTVVAVTQEDNKILAVGNEAKEMLGRTPENIVARKPLKYGVIADYVVTEALLRYFIDKVAGTSRLFKPEVMVCVPSGVTPVERRAVLDATMSAGARVAYLIDEPLAAAIGAKIPIAQPSGSMIIDIGGGSAEAAVISLGGVVVHGSVRVGGTALDEAIITYMRRSYNLIIGERMAEEIKLELGTALPIEHGLSMEVKGRSAVDGLPKAVEITAMQVYEALNPYLAQIVQMVSNVLERTPPELAADIIDKGIVMSGGTSMLKNFDKLMMEKTGVPVYLAEQPLLCVALGTGLAIENIDLYRRGITK